MQEVVYIIYMISYDINYIYIYISYILYIQLPASKFLNFYLIPVSTDYRPSQTVNKTQKMVPSQFYFNQKYSNTVSPECIITIEAQFKHSYSTV